MQEVDKPLVFLIYYNSMKVLIPCVSKKLNKRAKACDMYVSPLFKKALAYARTIADDKDIYILSAKHYVLKLNDVIEPYNKTIAGASDSQVRVWASKVYDKMKSMNFDFGEKTIFLTGEAYRRHLINKFDNAECPVKNCKGIGYMLQWFDKKLGVNESLSDYLQLMSENLDDNTIY